MQCFIPKISFASLSASEKEIFNTLDTTPYGETCAQRVAEKLLDRTLEVNDLFLSHRDYCGLGIFYKDGTFIFGTVNDGYGPDETIVSFNTQEEFVSWLAKETDQSMSLYGESFNNQTITRLRLEWFLEDNYWQTWNAFCAYVHLRNKGQMFSARAEEPYESKD